MQHPVVIVGAGPIGLAAAAHAVERALSCVVFEAGPCAAAAVSCWAHVRLFSTWSDLIDPAARRLLEATQNWTQPDHDAYPTGGEWRNKYLQPLADAVDSSPCGAVHYDSQVIGISRAGVDLRVDAGRKAAPFAVHLQGPAGHQRVLASAVVDASGTWSCPNPLGADGFPAIGERDKAERISYGIPDLTDPAIAARYSGKHVAVAGTGASAHGALIALAAISEHNAATRISWLVRRADAHEAFDGGNDRLTRRNKLSQDAEAIVASELVNTMTAFRTESVNVQHDGRLEIRSTDGQRLEDVDEVVVTTGFRPDYGFLSEVRLDLDPALESTRKLAALIHPDHHSCEDVPLHGHLELTQPEQHLYVVGMKSYGRAPSFLAMTGYEQVRSVVDALASDVTTARE